MIFKSVHAMFIKIFTYLWVDKRNNMGVSEKRLSLSRLWPYHRYLFGKTIYIKQVEHQRKVFFHQMFSYPNEIPIVQNCWQSISMFHSSWCWNRVKSTSWVCLKIGYPIPSSGLASFSLWNSPILLWLPSFLNSRWLWNITKFCSKSSFIPEIRPSNLPSPGGRVLSFASSAPWSQHLSPLRSTSTNDRPGPSAREGPGDRPRQAVSDHVHWMKIGSSPWETGIYGDLSIIFFLQCWQ